MSHWTKHDNDELDEIVKKQQTQGTYEARFACSNCGNVYYITLRKGVRADQCNHKCPNCGCN